MLIQGSSNTNKTSLLAKKYNDLILQGVLPDEILVVVLNSFKKSEFINKIRENGNNLSGKNIVTFWGLCYGAFRDNWNYISGLINTPEEVQPNLCGLEVSQFIFKQSIKEADFSDYISKINLLHQLFRRYSLIVQNCFSPKEIKERSRLLNESFYPDAQKAIDDYKLRTNKYVSFDYLRQLSVLPLIYKNTDYFKNIKYLLADDADEYSYAFWQFVENIMPNLKDYMICFDNNGSTRCGYLCAYKSGVKDFVSKYAPEIQVIEDKSVFGKLADIFFNNINAGKRTEISLNPVPHNIVSSSELPLGSPFKVDIHKNYKDSFKRLDMFEIVSDDVKKLINSGIKPSEIAIITPLADSIVTKEFFLGSGIKIQFLTGSEKLYDYDFIKHIIYVIKLAEGLILKDFELKDLIVNLLKIPYKKCIDIIKSYEKTRELKHLKFDDEKYDNTYVKLNSVINSLKKSKRSLSEEIKIVFANLINQDNIDKTVYNFLVKEAESFEKAFSSDFKNITEEFIIQIENSVVSENSSDAVVIDKDRVIISTPQKIIDYSIKTKYQLWLDISSSEWLKQDTGTLYNAWVFNRDWQKNSYTLEDNILLTRDKIARIVRKLMLCASCEVVFYSSLYDDLGRENFSGLSDFIVLPQTKKVEFKIVPRPDQKKVLDYKKGRLGIMAVPGAGKTTILLALIIKLIKEGVKSENIFVLTYMESAAKNFKERLKNALSDSSVLPNISTIHGLALRIIKENGNYNKVGLDENFEICDDTFKEKIIKEIFFKLKIDEEKYDNYLRCISVVKLSGNSYEGNSKYKEINEFYNFLNQYNIELKKNNMVDYDDMLCFALKLLKENSNIREYYQNICHYIIEDEAQDSTSIQQELIKLLTGKYNNLVRCGDINQAITSTFTDSSIKGFKSFINNNLKVEMSTSQRCSKAVYSLANALVKEAMSDSDKKDAFYNIEILGTDKNPKTDIIPKYLIFEKESDEKTFILSKIKEIINSEPNASIAILLRLNNQVNEYCEWFSANGIKTSVRTDCLSQKRIYKIIIAVLKIILEPLNNKSVLNLAKIYNNEGISNFENQDFEFIKNLKEPFIYQNIDNLASQSLWQLYFDIDYWLNNSTSKVDITAQNIGMYYAENSAEKSNIGLISAIIRRLNINNETTEELIKKLEYISEKSSVMYKFFEDEISTTDNSINIMTMHKSKGDEFDYVFCPCMNEENYPVSIKHTKLKSGSHFIQTIKSLQTNEPVKNVDELKTEQINETLRLLYVGITRAKKGLYITNSKNYQRRKNTENLGILTKIIPV